MAIGSVTRTAENTATYPHEAHPDWPVTAADCFKFRNKIGVDVAAEALRDYRRRRGSVDELLRYAEVCRVARVMRPYLEALS